MNRLPVVLAVAIFATACGDDNKAPTTPSTPAAPQFTAQLTAANEVPPVTNADGQATGTATITLNVTRDAAQNITAATADFQVTMSGFPANTALTGAHIHPGRPGQTGGVVVSTGLAAGEQVLANGSGTLTRNGINVAASLAQNMLNDPAGFYFNVHTTLNPSGAIRGPLARSR